MQVWMEQRLLFPSPRSVWRSSSHRKDVDQFLAYAAEENLEAVAVAVVTEDPRLVLIWRGKEIVNISRAFLDTKRCTSGDRCCRLRCRQRQTII